MSRADLKSRAKVSLAGSWGTAISVLVVEYAILAALEAIFHFQLTPDYCYYSHSFGTITISGASLSVVAMLAQTPLAVGVAGVFLKLIRGQQVNVMDMFDGIKVYFIPALVAGVVGNLLTSVGLVLLVVPGIVLGLGLSQTIYLLRDHPEMNGVDALKASWDMMRGHKGELFVLYLSFLPWYLACIVVVPILYVAPYISATMAAYYENLSSATNAEYKPL